MRSARSVRWGMLAGPWRTWPSRWPPDGPKPASRHRVAVESGNTADNREVDTTVITLTETAAGKVKELLEQEGQSEVALRVAVQPGGCSGLRYAMYLDDQMSEKDVLEE